MFDFFIYTGLGAVIGYAVATKERRAKIVSKLNHWTKPHKEEANSTKADDKKV